MLNNFMAIGLYVKNLEKSFNFYKNILKLEVEAEDLKNNFAAFKIGDTVIELISEETIEDMCGKKYFGAGVKKQNFLLALEVPSVNKAVKELKKKVSFLLPKLNLRRGGKRLHILRILMAIFGRYVNKPESENSDLKIYKISLFKSKT